MILPWVGLLVSVFLATGPSYIYLPEHGEHISPQQLLPKQPRSLLPWAPPQVSPGPAGTDAGGHGRVSPDGEEDWRGPARRSSSGGSWGGWGCTVLISQPHFLFPGSSGLALFLLCCSGALLSSHSHPLRRDIQSDVITELQFSFSKLMEEYVSAHQISFLSHFFEMPSLAPRSSL